MRSSEAATGICCDFIVIVITNTKEYCKNNINNLLKDWPGGSYLAFKGKPEVPGYRLLAAIGYKYNSHRVLSFVTTEGAEIAKPDNNYLSN